jgi:hypothetical protein
MAKQKSLLFRALKPADFAIEIPDFHVTPIDKLARGFHGIRVGIGLDRFVRGYAVVSINQVRPIGRHDPLSLPRDNARKNGSGEHGAMREPMEPGLLKSGTGQKRLRHKGIRIRSYVRARLMSHMNLAILKEQAERCRRLAKHADLFTQKRLLDLALEYDAKIAALEPQPSAASRILRNGEA